MREFEEFFDDNFDLNADGFISVDEQLKFFEEMEVIEALPDDEKWDAFRSYGTEDGEPEYFRITTLFTSMGMSPLDDFGQSDYEDLLKVAGIDDSYFEDLWEVLDADKDGIMDPNEVEKMWTQVYEMLEEELGGEITEDGVSLAQTQDPVIIGFFLFGVLLMGVLVGNMVMDNETRGY